MSKKIRAGSSDPAVQKIIKAEKRIEDCPFDIEAWNVLIRDAQGKKIEEARPFFERLVVQVKLQGIGQGMGGVWRRSLMGFWFPLPA